MPLSPILLLQLMSIIKLDAVHNRFNRTRALFRSSTTLVSQDGGWKGRGSRFEEGREIAREFEFEHAPGQVSWGGKGCLLDNNWEDGSIVQIPRCK